jgi:hypothetical protein
MWTNILTTIFFWAALSQQAALPCDAVTHQFSDYPIAVYAGTLHIPNYYVNSGDVWRDDMGKEVAPPNVNFAGKYYIGLHSCGTQCRYFTLSDLTTGNESRALDMFSGNGGGHKKLETDECT